MSDMVLRYLLQKRSLNPCRNPVAFFLCERKEIGSENSMDLARFPWLLLSVCLVLRPLPETKKLSGREDSLALWSQISKTAGEQLFLTRACAAQRQAPGHPHPWGASVFGVAPCALPAPPSRLPEMLSVAHPKPLPSDWENQVRASSFLP